MKHILFFISHQPDPRFIKQINFLAKKHKVSLVHFHRSTLATLDECIEERVTCHNLGNVPNASQPFKRIWIYIKTILRIRKIISKGTFNLVLVNNIDVVILYLLARFRFFNKKQPAKLAVEISDLREFVFKNSFMSKRIRAVERYVYARYVDKLIVTSKKYYSYHFEKFFKKEVFVLENKMLSYEQVNDVSIQKHKNEKTIIGIVGLLLRKEEYIQLFETYKNHPEIEIHIHGIGHYQHIVEAYAEAHENIIYFGPYNVFTDAQRIYNSLDVIYLVYDSKQISLNNRLALPNKLYECMYYKVPIICSKGTYLEEIVVGLGIGTSIHYKQANAIKDTVAHIIKHSAVFEENFSKLDKNAYFGDNDYIAFESFLMN